MHNLRAAILSLGLDLTEFARDLNWTRSKLSKVLNNRQTLPFEEEIRVLNLLNRRLPNKFKHRYTYREIYMRPVPEEIKKYFKEEKHGEKQG